MDLTDVQLLQSIWAALRRIEDNLALPPAPLELPAPMIYVDAPDLTDVVEAVNGLKPGATADDIARALAAVLAPQQIPAEMPGMAEFNAAVKELSWRLKGTGAQAYGGGAVNLQPGQTVGVNNFPATQPVTGPVTDAQLRASAVPVSGFPADQLVHATNLDIALSALRDAITKSGATTKTLADVVAALASVPVTGTFWQATQPVSGTVTANLGTIDGAATETTLAAIPSRADKTKYRTDTYTTTASGTTVDVSAYPLGFFAVQVKGTGAAAATWDIRLEGSLDGTNFSQILQHTNTTGDGAVLWSGAANSVSRYFRSRVAGLTLGTATNVVVSILGKGV